MLPPLKPIAMKERISLIFIEHGEIDVHDGAFVVVDKNGVRIHIPVGSIACIMLEPGTRVSHAPPHWPPGSVPCWCGSGRPGCGSMRPASPAARAPIGCSIRPSWPWTTRPGSRSCARCTSCASERRRRSGAASSSCAASRARGSGRPTTTSPSTSASPGRADATTTPTGTQRSAQPLPVIRHRLSLRYHRGRRAGGRLCPGGRLHPHRQAPVVRLRHRRPLQVRHGGPGGIQGRRQGAAAARARGTAGLSRRLPRDQAARRIIP